MYTLYWITNFNKLNIKFTTAYHIIYDNNFEYWQLIIS